MKVQTQKTKIEKLVIQKNMQGRVIKLFVTLNDKDKTREAQQKIFLDESGIQSDKFYGKNPMRSVLITSIDSYAITQENEIDIEHGSLGENILIDINPYALTPGSQIKIGNALLEITQNCTLCKGLSTLNSKLPKLLKNDRGIFAKVINGSFEIAIDDKVEILNY